MLLSRDGQAARQPGPGLAELSAHLERPYWSMPQPPSFRSFGEVTGRASQLYRREGATRVCIAALEPLRDCGDTVPVGARLPMTAGSGAGCCWPTATPTPVGSCWTRRHSPNAPWRVRRQGWAQRAPPKRTRLSPDVGAGAGPGRRRGRRGGVGQDRSTGWDDNPARDGRPTCWPPAPPDRTAVTRGCDAGR